MWMEPRPRIGRTLDTCNRFSPTNQISRLRTLGGCSGGWGEQVNANTHTHGVPLIHSVDGASVKDRTHLDTCKRGPPKLN